MIHLVDLWIHNLTQSPIKHEREIKSRIVAVGLSALVPIEAALRLLDATLTVSLYVLFQPVILTAKTIKKIKDPSYTKTTFANEESKKLNDMFDTVAKAVLCTSSIVLTPLIAPFSPRALVHLHADMRLVTLPNTVTNPGLAKTESMNQPNPHLNQDVKKNIDEKFLCFHTNEEDRKRLQKYGLAVPNSILLYGPSNAANKTAAQYMASKLGKNLIELDFTDEKALKASLDKFDPTKDICYFNVKKISREVLKKSTDQLDKAKRTYILSAKESEGYDTQVKVEVSLPEAQVREDILHEELDTLPLADKFDFAKSTQATEAMKIKTIRKHLLTIKRNAFQKNSQITTELALEVLQTGKKAKKQNGTPVVSDFVGMEELHDKFDLYLQVLKDPEEAKEYGVKMPAGMLLYGPPGCGKTYTAKHLCDYAKSKGVELNFFEMKASDVASKWKGESVKKIREMFEKAKEIAPVILFIDECEGLFPSRDKLTDTLSAERNQELNEVLQMIEQAKDHAIIVIGATNHISSIDSAILRTGRFDYTFEVKPPNEEMRRKMFEAKLKKCDTNIDLNTIAKSSEGFSASDIETTVNDASLTSWRQKTPITQIILMNSLEDVKRKKASVNLTPKQTDAASLNALRQLIENLDPAKSAANDMHDDE